MPIEITGDDAFVEKASAEYIRDQELKAAKVDRLVGDILSKDALPEEQRRREIGELIRPLIW